MKTKFFVLTVAVAALIVCDCVGYTAPPSRPPVKGTTFTIERATSRVDADIPMHIFIDGAQSNYYLVNGETELIPIDEETHDIYVKVGTFQSETLNFTAAHGTVSFVASVEAREVVLSRKDGGSNGVAKPSGGKKLGWTALSSCPDDGWASVPISERVEYASLYDDVISMLIRNYEIDMISKESGYIRTKWANRKETNGHDEISYRSKITIKFSPQKSKIEVNAESERNISDGGWEKGCDTQVLATMKQNLQGLSGY